MVTHSSVLAWSISGTGEPGGLLSMGSHRVGHDWSDLAAAAAVYLLEKAMAPHSSTLAWKIPWTEEPGGLKSMGSIKSQTRLSDFTLTFHFHALEKEMATHSSVLVWRIPGTGSLVGCCLWGRTESDRLKRLSSSSSSSPNYLLIYWPATASNTELGLGNKFCYFLTI